MARSAAGTRAPTGANSSAASSSSGGALVRCAGPFGAEAAGEVDRRLIARPDEGEHAATLSPRHLGDDVRRRAEAVEPEPFGVARHGERAVADQPGAEQRRRMSIVALAGEGEAVAFVGDAVVAVAAVQGVAGEARVRAQVLPPAPAIAAGAAGPAEPGDADALPFAEPLDARAERRDAPHDLVPRHDRQPRLGQVAVHHVEIGAADPAGRNTNQDFARAGLGHRPFLQGERGAIAAINHGAHGGSAGHRRLTPR